MWIVTALCLVSWAAIQSQRSTNRAVDPAPQSPVFQAEANLVLVPVFVFTHDGLERGGTREEKGCERNEGQETFSIG